MIDDCCAHIRHGGRHRLLLDGDLEVEVVADEQKIDQVMVNLVNNAAKYAPDAPDSISISNVCRAPLGSASGTKDPGSPRSSRRSYLSATTGFPVTSLPV